MKKLGDLPPPSVIPCLETVSCEKAYLSVLIVAAERASERASEQQHNLNSRKIILAATNSTSHQFLPECITLADIVSHRLAQLRLIRVEF